MTVKTRPSIPAKLAVLLVLVSFAALGAPIAGAAAEEVATPISYRFEQLAEWEKQLGEGQVVAVTVNKRLRSLRTTLKDGQHVLAKYKAKGLPKAQAAL